MNDETLQCIIDEMSKLWEDEEEIPEELLRARIFLLFKKGSIKNVENYWPISLLSTITRILARIEKTG